MNPKPDTVTDYQDRVHRVQAHLAAHLDDELDINALARIAHFSPFHFHRIFTAIVGEPIGAHLRRLRLDRAAQQLAADSDQIVRIARTAGFESHESFTRAFKFALGVTPSEYRQLDQHARSALRQKHVLPKPITTGVTRMNVRIRTLPETRVAFIAATGPYSQAGPVFGRLMAWAGMNGHIRNGTMPIGVYYDDPTSIAPEKLRFEACLPVDQSATPVGEINTRTLPGGQYAVTIHTGSYANLSDTYTKLFRDWLPSSGRELRDEPCIEYYLTDPRTTPDAENKTEVCVPIK